MILPHLRSVPHHTAHTTFYRFHVVRLDGTHAYSPLFDTVHSFWFCRLPLHTLPTCPTTILTPLLSPLHRTALTCAITLHPTFTTYLPRSHPLYHDTATTAFYGLRYARYTITVTTFVSCYAPTPRVCCRVADLLGDLRVVGVAVLTGYVVTVTFVGDSYTYSVLLLIHSRSVVLLLLIIDYDTI